VVALKHWFFDAKNGNPIFGYEERPVPEMSDVQFLCIFFRYRGNRDKYIKTREGFILAYSITNRSTFEEII